MQDVYLIYDIGKTNKKILLFNNNGEVVAEYGEHFGESIDEDGFACDDIEQIGSWILGQYEQLKANGRYRIKAINFATYGASFVHIGKYGKVLTPLYNYLKPIPKSITDHFLHTYFDGNAENFVLNTASPLMGMLNSGLQLYWIKHTKPALWNTIAYSLHLPQYLYYLFTKNPTSDYTSIGCHTGLYNVVNQQYHPWVFAEGVDKKLAPIKKVVTALADGTLVGNGLHDSSAAIIPYIQQYKEPFILISTGTWCINMNPFNSEPLTVEELHKDCLTYLQANGKPVKASRIFLGKEHAMRCQQIAAHFNCADDFYKTVLLEHIDESDFVPAFMEGSGPQPMTAKPVWDIAKYPAASIAYNCLMKGLVALLSESIALIDDAMITTFYIDGGFAGNFIFQHYLRECFPHKAIKVVGFPQATALGTYLSLREQLDMMKT
jgi:sugar (pentulose or hexulose) kinase